VYRLGVLNKAKPGLIILGWGASMAAFTLGAIFQGLLLPHVPISGGALLSKVINGNPLVLLVFYGGLFGTSVLAAVIIAELGHSVLSFFASYGLASLLTYIVLALPDILGMFPIPGALEESATIFTFSALFPLPFLLGFVGALIGSALSERFPWN
jgi:hypothetical protein